MDDVDATQLRQEVEDAARLKRVNTKLEVEATGDCLWCFEEITHPKRWCDADCRDQWSKDKVRKRV